MLLPISDDDRALTRRAYVTPTLVVLNILVFFVFQGMGSNVGFSNGYSVVPYELSTGTDLTVPQTIAFEGEQVQIVHAPGPTPIYLTLLTSMFMHGGFMHLAGNLLFLWIFGDNVEHRFGRRMFLGFYLLSGLAGALAQIALAPDSLIPMLGASGAISGVMGAYLMLFPRNRVHVLFFFAVLSLPAVIVLGLWIAFQVFGSIGANPNGGGVAYAAHIGGFVAGLLAGLVVRLRVKAEPPNVFTRPAQTDPYRKRRFY
ncbi:MAG: rhomboid family intramembrane serine protease [Rhodothermales bacterium]